MKRVLFSDSGATLLEFYIRTVLSNSNSAHNLRTDCKRNWFSCRIIPVNSDPWGHARFAEFAVSLLFHCSPAWTGSVSGNHIDLYIRGNVYRITLMYSKLCNYLSAQSSEKQCRTLTIKTQPKTRVCKSALSPHPNFRGKSRNNRDLLIIFILLINYAQLLFSS